MQMSRKCKWKWSKSTSFSSLMEWWVSCLHWLQMNPFFLPKLEPLNSHWDFSVSECSICCEKSSYLKYFTQVTLKWEYMLSLDLKKGGKKSFHILTCSWECNCSCHITKLYSNFFKENGVQIIFLTLLTDFPVLLLFQSAQNLAQISDLQAQLEEALKEKQDVQEKVSTGLWLSAGHWCHSFKWRA